MTMQLVLAISRPSMVRGTFLIARLAKVRASALNLFVFLFFLSSNSIANELVEYEGRSLPNFGKSMEFFRDKTNKLKIEDIGMLSDSDWGRQPNYSLVFGYTTDTVWLRSAIVNSTSQLHNPFFELAYANVDYVDVFLVDGKGNQQHWQTGDMRPFSQRPINHRHFIIPLILKPHAEYQLYVKASSSGSVRLPSRLWEQNEFHLQDQRAYSLHFLYFGILLVMIFYNLFLYMSLQDLNYLRYVVLSCSVLVMQGVLNGIFVQAFLQEYQVTANVMSHNAINLNLVVVSWFTYHFLNVKEKYPYMAVLLKFNIVAGLAIVFARMIFFDGNIHVYLSTLSMLFVLFTYGMVLTLGFISWHRGDPSGRFYVIAFGLLFLSCIAVALSYSGVLPIYWFSERLLQLGSVVEVVLLSLALAARIKLEREQKFKAIEESQKHQWALQQASIESQAKNNVISSLSHEIRNPMNGILGMCEVLLNGNLSKHHHQQVQSMRATCVHLVSLLENFLSHAKLEVIDEPSRVGCIELREAVQNIIDLYSQTAEVKGLKIESSIDPEIPRLLLVNRQEYQQILTNLISNALKYTDTGSVHVSVILEKKADSAYLKTLVKDTGIGIDKADSDKIFQAFSQLDSGLSRDVQGVGLGLSICKRLVGRLNGEINFQSQRSKGTTFVFTVPVFLACNETNNREVNFSGATLSGLNVMVVEDVSINRDVTAALLENYGCKVDTAEDGMVALAKLKIMASKRENLDLILLDIYMPKLGGVETAKRIRALSDGYFANTSIIALTANALSSDIDNYLEAGIDDVLTKPISENKLMQLLSQSPDVGPSKTDMSLTYTALFRDYQDDLGDEGLVTLIDTLQGVCRDNTAAILNSVETGNQHDLKKHLHSLRGTSATFRLKELESVAAEMQSANSDPKVPLTEVQKQLLVSQLNLAAETCLIDLEAIKLRILES